MSDGEERRDGTCWVICPSCNETIGLKGTEIESTAVHGKQFAQFFCHVCKAGWRVLADYQAVKDPIDD